MGIKIVNSTVIGLLLLTIVFNIILYNRQTSLQDRQTSIKNAVEDTRTVKVNLPDELKGKMDAAVTAYLNKMKESQSVFAKQVKSSEEENRNLIKKYQNDFENLLKTFAESVKASEKRHENMVTAAFAKMDLENRKQIDQATKGIISFAKQKISGNESAAREAHEKAQEYLKKRDFVMARLYCLNAINHAPDNKVFFETLIDIEKSKGTDSTQAELETIRSVLELGIYQVESKDIPDMMKMLAYINGQHKSISEKNARNQMQEEKKKCMEALASLKANGKYAWNKITQDMSKASLAWVRERLAVLDSLNSAELASEDAEFCRSEIEKSNALLGYLAAMLTIDNALSKAEKLLDAANPQFPAISSMVQSSNNVLSQLWSINFDLLPGAAREKAVAQASRIAKIETVFNKKKSALAMAEINRIYRKLDDILAGNRTRKIKTLENGMKQIMNLLPEIYDLNCRRDVEEKIGKLTDKVRKYSKERYESYQNWAVRKCKDAFKLYGSWNRVDEPDAVRVVNTYLLRIDPACLSPAVLRVYQDVLQKQFAEMGWKKIAEMETELATCYKKTIEDCPNED